jgi:hypothetical protein
VKRTPLKRKTALKATTSLSRTPPKRRKKTDLQKLKAKLWELCKHITRTRYGNVCYTCGKGDLAGSNWHTGHYISSSICSTALRYDLENLRPQCYSCNINKSGNWLAYELHLKEDSIDTEALKARNQATKNLSYRDDWYEAKIAEYETLC